MLVGMLQMTAVTTAQASASASPLGSSRLGTSINLWHSFLKRLEDWTEGAGSGVFALLYRQVSRLR